MISFIKGGEVTEMPTEEGKSWNIKRNPVTGKFEITFVTGVAQIRYDNADVETRVDAHAARDIEITETQGQTGLGQFVSDNGNIEITVPEDLIDVTENKNDVNISAMGNGQNAGNVTIHAANGGVGDNENRILVNAEGTVDVENKDDLYADSDVDLTIRVTTDGADMYVTSDQGIDLTNVSGDAHIEELHAETNASVVSPQSIMIQDLAAGGTLSLNAQDGDINVAKTTGLITAKRIEASGNVTMNLDSGLKDAQADKVKEYEDAVIREAEAAAKVEGLQNKISADNNQEQNLTNSIAYANNMIANAEVTDQQAADAKLVLEDENATEAEKEAALEKVEKMQAQIDEIVEWVTEELGHELETLKNVERIEAIPEILQTEKDRVIAERQGYEALLLAAQAELTAAQADLTTKTAALNNETPAILAGGNVDLTLKEGASIGDSTNSVSIETGNGGKISLKAENGGRLNNVFIESGNDVSLDNINATGTVRTDVNGSVTQAPGNNGPLVSANEAILNTTGTVGTSENPINLDVNKFSGSGTEVVISNDKLLEVVSVTGIKVSGDPESGDITIRANGDITAGNNNGNVNVSGNKVTIITNGDIGKNGNSIKVDSDLLHTESNGLNLESGKDIVIDQIIAEGDVNIDAAGKVTGKDENTVVKGDHVNIIAGGDITGANNTPLDVKAYSGATSYSRAGHVLMDVTIVPRRTWTYSEDDYEDDDNNEDSWEEDDYPYIALPIVIKEIKVPKASKVKVKAKANVEEVPADETEKKDDTADKVLKVTNEDKKPAVENIKEAFDDVKPENTLAIVLAALLVLFFAALAMIMILRYNNNRKPTGQA